MCYSIAFIHFHALFLITPFHSLHYFYGSLCNSPFKKFIRVSFSYFPQVPSTIFVYAIVCPSESCTAASLSLFFLQYPDPNNYPTVSIKSHLASLILSYAMFLKPWFSNLLTNHGQHQYFYSNYHCSAWTSLVNPPPNRTFPWIIFLYLPSPKFYKIDFKLKTDLLVSIFYSWTFLIYFGPI